MQWPLVDGRGRAVGINTMINGGMALAVPGYMVDQMLDDLLGAARVEQVIAAAI